MQRRWVWAGFGSAGGYPRRFLEWDRFRRGGADLGLRQDLQRGHYTAGVHQRGEHRSDCQAHQRKRHSVGVQNLLAACKHNAARAGPLAGRGLSDGRCPLRIHALPLHADPARCGQFDSRGSCSGSAAGQDADRLGNLHARDQSAVVHWAHLPSASAWPLGFGAVWQQRLSLGRFLQCPRISHAHLLEQPVADLIGGGCGDP